MASGFPGSIDNFTDPLSNSPLTSPNHATLHADVNDAVEKIETYMGLVKVIPTGVSSTGGTAATLAANGTITVGSLNTSVTVSGAFSSLYDNYKIIYSGGVGNALQDITMTLGATATGYYWSDHAVSFVNGTVSTTGSNATSNAYWRVGKNLSGGALINMDIFNPFLSVRTFFASNAAFSQTNAGFITNGGFLDNNTSYTAFTVTPLATTITGGTIRVYGYRN